MARTQKFRQALWALPYGACVSQDSPEMARTHNASIGRIPLGKLWPEFPFAKEILDPEFPLRDLVPMDSRFKAPSVTRAVTIKVYPSPPFLPPNLLTPSLPSSALPPLISPPSLESPPARNRAKTGGPKSAIFSAGRRVAEMAGRAGPGRVGPGRIDSTFCTHSQQRARAPREPKWNY